jgi:hypothetical protein
MRWLLHVPLRLRSVLPRVAYAAVSVAVPLLISMQMGANAQSEATPPPPAPVEDRLSRLENRVESLSPEKDIFDKIQAVSGLSGLVTGIAVVVIAQYFTGKQRRTEEQQKAQDTQIQRIQTVGVFMPHLVSGREMDRQVALSAIEALDIEALEMKQTLATHLLRSIETANAVTRFAEADSHGDSTSQEHDGESLLPIFNAVVAQAQRYEQIRGSREPGSERTISMTRLVEATKERVRLHPLTEEQIAQLFTSGDGGRIAALAVLQAEPQPQFFRNVTDAIANSRSAFEQYQALRATAVMLPALSPDQRRELKAILIDQRDPGPGKFIVRDSDRWGLSQQILDDIDKLDG